MGILYDARKSKNIDDHYLYLRKGCELMMCREE